MCSANRVIPHVVYHIATMGNWKEVVVEQMCVLRNTGLSSALASVNDFVHVTMVGDGADFVHAAAASTDTPIRIVRSDPNTLHYETFAMVEIESLAKTTERPILYFHTKGVSAPDNLEKVQWRHVMQRYVLDQWEANVQLLESNEWDATGWNWWNHGHKHFSGTFWIARADWIRKLPDYVQFHHSHALSRFSCELWIGSWNNCRAYSHGIKNAVTWDCGFDYTPYLPKSKVAITWVSGSDQRRTSDLGHLVASFHRIGDAHELITKIIHVDKWKHALKIGMLKQVAKSANTPYVFWVDADCEFLGMLNVEELVQKPLNAVNHFGFNACGEAPGFDDGLKAMLLNPERAGYWQACMWGGERESVIEACRGVEKIIGNRSNDEPSLNAYLLNNRDLVHTLPCRYAAPSQFTRMPQYEKSYQEKCGGPPRISHVNRDINT